MRKRMNRTFPARMREERLSGCDTWPLASAFAIGGVPIDNRVVQPPLAGIANWAFREQSRRHGVGLAVSEMVSAHGIAHDNARTMDMLATERDGGPVAIQLFGADPAVMAEAARAVAGCGADLIDVNMGCPVKKVLKTGAGAALLTDPDAGARVVEAMTRAVDVPVTVKMRRGVTPASSDPVGAARRFVAAGAAAITFHPRTARDEYAGRADHVHTAEVAAAVDVPVIASGDIDSPGEAVRVMRETGAAAVAIGRPAFGNPWLFRDVLEAVPARMRPLPEVVEEIRRFVADVRIALGESRGCAYMRKFYPWYLAGHDVPAADRQELLVAPTLDDALTLLSRVVERSDGLKAQHELDYGTAPLSALSGP